MKRCSLGLEATLPTEIDTSALPIFPPTPTDIQGPPSTSEVVFTGHYWTFLSYFSELFLGNSGSIVLRISNENGGRFANTFSAGDYAVGAIAASPLGLRKVDASSTGAMKVHLLDLPFAELRVPDRNPRKFRMGNNYVRAGNPPSVAYNLLVTEHGDNTAQELQLWYGAGDDYMVGGYLATPPMYLRADPPPI